MKDFDADELDPLFESDDDWSELQKILLANLDDFLSAAPNLES